MTHRRLWKRRDIGAVVLDFLVLMHQIVRASVPLMNVAHANAVERGRKDGRVVCLRAISASTSPRNATTTSG